MIKSLLKEYGVVWTVNRSMYAAKLKMMKNVPITEHLFEKNLKVKRINIFDFSLEGISDFLVKLNDDKKNEIIKIADNAIEGKVTGFSSIELDFNNPINWHLNPLSGKEHSKNKKWYEIADFDESVGDIKVIWEASRLTHFLYFARAFLITNDSKYYEAFVKQLKEWLVSNPYSYGANYKCGQEATLRMINVLISYSVFNKFGLISDEKQKLVINLVEGSYKKVRSNFFYAHKCIKNNHTFTEILGIIIGAWCCEDEKIIKKAYDLMDSEIRNQFFEDGGFSQYSFNYHRFTLQIMECLYKVSEKTGYYITESERLKKSVLLLYQVQEEKTGDVPNYGSNDGALIFPLSSCEYRDYRPVLNTMYALIEGKRLYDHGDYDEELIWFCGKFQLPREHIKKKPSRYDQSGYYILRHSDGFLMTCLQNYKSRPAHMDQLHIDLWHKGINIFCDNGTYSYASKLGKELSLTSGHNTAKVNNIEQMNKRNTFLITEWTKKLDVDYTSNTFLGKMTSLNGYEHNRLIIKKDEGYIVNDEIIAKSDTCEFIFHTPCQVEIINDGFILSINGNDIAIVKAEGKITVNESYRSLYYLRKNVINKVSIERKFQNYVCNSSIEIILL